MWVNMRGNHKAAPHSYRHVYEPKGYNYKILLRKIPINFIIRAFGTQDSFLPLVPTNPF